MTTETRELVERLTGLLAKATPGPWKTKDADSPLHQLISANGDDLSGKRNGGVYIGRAQGPDTLHNAALIVGAVNALPDLLATITRLTEEVEGLKGALQGLETANDDLCGTRSGGTYLRMIDDDGASDALVALDDARRRARATLARSGSHG